jgi:hypothetical protein
MALVRCPECDAELEVADADLGRPMECGACGAPFTSRTDRRRPRDGDYRPRRHRSRVTAADVRDAKAAVAGPALGLILTGWISAVLCLLGGLALAALGYASRNDVGPDAEEDAIVMMVFGVASAVLGAPYCVLIAVGGHKMKRLDGTAWAYTSAVLGIATIVLCGPCIPISWAGVGVGIWAVVAMNQPVVKDVIEANARGDQPRDDEWDEDR